MELLLEENVKKADFHCFCGKVCRVQVTINTILFLTDIFGQLKLGVQIAEAGYYLSIPSAVANSDQNSSFKKLVAALPLDKILTETDSPYMGPVKGVDNTPDTVIQSIDTIAKIKNIDSETCRQAIRENYRQLFGL